jgi:cytoskeletal protein CcmA (bactofilin family)
MAIGRISGPLLKANLIRDGVDLAFETDLLYLDVVNSRIGVNTASPGTDLDINGTTRTTNLVVDNQLDIGNLHITGNTITSDSAVINFAASAGEPTVYHSKLQIDDLQISGNTISTTVSNSSIELLPNGTGTVNVVANTFITGNLEVTGNINTTGNVTIGGNIIIGDALTDNIVINAAIKSDLIPETDISYDLGSPLFRWRSVYVQDFYTNSINVPALNIGNLIFNDNSISTATGLDLYIDGNGTGGVRLGNFKIVDNVITNVVSNAISQIAQSGTGYFKIQGTNGFVPPRGTDAQRPTTYAVIGMTRYNTNSKALEVWDGTTWASPAGTSGAVSGTLAQDIAIEWALTLG